jgi:hypothetical protein
MPMPSSPLARLGAFRTELRACCTRRGDALFELGDALLSADSFLSLPHLSLEPTHRRGWGSAYAALACGRIDAERLRDLLVTSLPAADPLVFAVDVTTWPRCDAECSPQRGYYYHPSRHSAGQPIVAGWAFQWVCQLSFDRDSWTAPVDARRLHPLDDTDQTTWPAPTATLGCHDHQYGTVTVQAWAGLHPKQQRHPRHGTGGPRPIVRGTIIRVQVERVPARTRPPKVLWLWWAGPGDLDLELAWRAYIRRFDLEHTVRLCKQTLGWTTPRPRHPEQADRWTWLVLAAYTAAPGPPGRGRCAAAVGRLRPPPRLSPYRVRRGFPRLLCALGSPASAPKPAGAPRAAPRAAAAGLRPATRRSKSPPASPGRTRRRRPPPPRPPDRPTITTKRPPTSFDGQLDMPKG